MLMNTEFSSTEIMKLFLRIVNKYNSMEKVPVAHGGKSGLYHSERHMLDTIASNPDLNITEYATALGVTKGAISQIVNKLESKGFVRRYKKGSNDKAVYVELTKQGKDVTERRKQVNEQTLKPLTEELNKHTDKEVAFLVAMFRWMDDYFDESKKNMEAHAREK